VSLGSFELRFTPRFTEMENLNNFFYVDKNCDVAIAQLRSIDSPVYGSATEPSIMSVAVTSLLSSRDRHPGSVSVDQAAGKYLGVVVGA
jgi:hypothetical protein